MTRGERQPARLARPENRRVTAVAVAAVAVLVLILGSLVVRGPLQRRFDSESSESTAKARAVWVLAAAFEGPLEAQQLTAASRIAVIDVLDGNGLLRAVPDSELRVALEWAGYSDTTHLSVDVAQVIGEQHGARAVVAGGLRGLERGYAIELRAIDPGTGGVLVTASAETETAEGVIERTRELAREIGIWLNERYGAP